MDRNQRKTPSRNEESPLVCAAKEEVLPGYEEYLVLLQERNKLLKRLRKKNKNQIEIERKEQGFSLYVNGPHKAGNHGQGQPPGTKNTIPTQPKTARKPKTAGELRNYNMLDNQALQEIAREEIERQKEANRVKTAPSARERRRNWNVESVEIKTTSGSKRVKAPDILTGRYTDDFEPDEDSDDFDSSGSDYTEVQGKQRKPMRKPPPPRESDMFNSSDSFNSEDEEVAVSRQMSSVLEADSDEEDMEIDASKFSKHSNGSPRKRGKPRYRDEDSDDDDEGSNEKLLLSMKELQKLRQSLVKNATIRESLSKGVHSDDEEITRESPIVEEVEEDIPVDDSSSIEDSPKHLNLNKMNNNKNDTIVLEFGGGLPPNKKVQKNLAMARRKDVDDEDQSMLGRKSQSGQNNRQPVRGSNKPQPVKTLGSENASKKSVRPLSANRRTPVAGSQDSDAEAMAVMAALQEENQKAAKGYKNDKQTPRGKPSQKARPLPSTPVYDKSERPPKSHQVRQSEESRDSYTEPLVPQGKIEQIMDRVLKMTPKWVPAQRDGHQRRLVKMLGKIEQSLVTESVDTDNKTARKPAANTPLKAVHHSVDKSASPGNSELIKVNIVITSNWGDPMRLGMTEIQLYDQNKTLVFIAPSDISVHRAEDCQGTVDLLVNGKFKTNKERNMWSCRYHARRPVEISLNARAGDKQGTKQKFSLSQMKIWNFNKSLNDLDMGVKDVQVYVGGDLVYKGAVEKGCGNQVFDYGHIIPLVQETESPAQQLPEESKISEKKVYHKGRDSVSKSQTPESSKRPTQKPSSTDKNMRKSKSRDSISSSASESTTSVRPSPPNRNQHRSPCPSPRGNSLASPRSSKSNNHRTISPSPSQEKKKTLRSISMTDQSSSGGESAPNSRPGSGVVKSTDREKPARSETRTLNHPTVSQQGSDSQSDSEDYHRDGPSKGSTPAKRRGVKTPKKSKRMAARLDGHSSTEVDSSKSINESTEHRPPLPHRKSEEKVQRKSLVEKSMEDKFKRPEPAPRAVDAKSAASKDSGKTKATVESEVDLDDTLKGANNTQGSQMSSSVSVTSSQDDTPMLQKLKDMNKKEQEMSRKKNVPHWLTKEDVSTPFESPYESTEVSHTPQPREEEYQPPPTPDEINSLIEEEMANYPTRKPPQPAERDLPEHGLATPMERIQQSRSKWREDPSLNLEESWQSLSQFNKSQHGRLSLDMDGDVMDEYINKAAKLAGLPAEPSIPEEGTMEMQQYQAQPDSDDENFVIPELPYGRELVINIRTTWGDKHYVGLTGVEAFSATGEQIRIIKIHANPSDINILPDYEKDPRVVTNLTDGVNRTRDDVHMWLAPFTSGSDHLVYATFDKPHKVALIRIWNYNKSRIHSYRGAREVIMSLNSSVIFRGEIARACGGVEGGTEAFGDTILFTMDEAILESVSQNDEAYEGEMLSDDEPFDIERPSTADAGEGPDRPFTRAVGNVKQMERERTAVSPVPVPEYEGDILVFKGKNITLNFTATWGDHHYLGLTGIEIVGKDGDALPVTMDMVEAHPRDVRHLQGHERDDRTLDKVIDGTNVTLSDEHMWLVPFTEGQNHTLAITFGQKVLMAGLRLWNYNKSKEDTYRGARIVHIAIDGKTISPPEGYLVRKGPGNCHFDFAQELSFSPETNNKPGGLLPSGGGTDDQDYEVVQMPCGFIYQLQLFSTWGDSYYVGLNGLEFYDANLQKIKLTESNISAYPDSVNVLEKIQNDVRTPDKLIDGVNDTMDGGHMWLAPILPGILNRVYLIFDQPTSISMIKLWNYSKTTNRGAKDFALLVDDLLVYNGTLQSVQQTARGILPTCEGPQQHHTILFVNNKDVLRKEKNTILNAPAGEQDVQMTNDKKIVSHYNDPKQKHAGKPVDQSKRPTTSVIHSKKRR